MNYYVVSIAKNVLGLCPQQSYQDNWEILGEFNCMEHAEQFFLFCNSGGYAGYIPSENDVHGVKISEEIKKIYASSCQY